MTTGRRDELPAATRAAYMDAGRAAAHRAHERERAAAGVVPPTDDEAFAAEIAALRAAGWTRLADSREARRAKNTR